MNLFTIKLEKDDFEEFCNTHNISKKDRNYILENWESWVDNEEEFLETIIHPGDIKSQLMVIRDNQGQFVIQNRKGEELGYISYYTDINI